MTESYINNKKIERTQFALDIKNGKIKKDALDTMLGEIDAHISNGSIENPYIGTTYTGKYKKTEWNERYLDFLVAEVSSAEVFNKESLAFLLEVAAYVHGSTKRFLKKVLFVFIGLCIIFWAGYIVGQRYSGNVRAMKKGMEFLEQQVSSLKTENVLLKENNRQLEEVNERLTAKLDAIKNAASTDEPTKSTGGQNGTEE